MAIERSLDQTEPRPEELGIEIEIVDAPGSVIEAEDGGVIIDFTAGSDGEIEVEFGENLADYMEDDVLDRLSSELIGMYNSDRNSRKEWEETYIKGLNQLGLKIEDRTTPWDGACGVTHPILSEAVVRFQSQAISEIFPAGGPVETKIIGKITDEKSKQARRIKDYLNYLVTVKMKEYRAETEKLLFSLPLAGSAFRKVYWDTTLCRPCAMFVPSEDLVVSYGAPSLAMAERVTHVMKRSANDLKKMQFSGFYRDIELTDPSPDPDDIQKKYDELTGEQPSYEFDGRHTLLEIHVDVDLEGFEDKHDGEPTEIALPYVVTIDLSSTKVLSVRRNWFEDDPKRTRRNHFVHYEYIPGLGFYGFGLIHMVGGIAKSATSILRQLVDAGTLSNLPGGLKARGLRIRGDDAPISPGEFRDVDIPGGAIRDNITFLPYKEPSNVLYQLLGNIVEEGRRFASLTDVKISDMSQQAPVGTTLALMERSMKVMSAIQARLHASMRDEFEILQGIVRDNGPHEYPYDIEGEGEFKGEDFDDRIDVIPVSDPNSATMAQRIMQYQAALQLAGTAPQMYNMPQLHRQMLEVLGIDDADKIIPLEDEIQSADPVTENMNILTEEPVKAYLWQDHEAHIATHMGASQDPQILELLSSAPNAEGIQGAFSAHITEHLAFQYRKQIEDQLGVPLPPQGEALPEDVEVQLSRLVSAAAQKLSAQQQAQAEEQKNQEMAEDPIIQMRQQELQIRQQESQAKIEEGKARLLLDSEKSGSRTSLERERLSVNQKIAAAKIDSSEKIDGARIGVDIISEMIKAQLEDGKLSSKEAEYATDIAVKISGLLLESDKNRSKESIEGVKAGSKIVEKILELSKALPRGE